MINLFKFIIGTVLGSFITLTSIRIYRHESIAFPPSHCDHCDHALKPWELIPVISFLLLRGKCHQCHHPIGFITFIGETLGGLITLFNPLSLVGILEIIFELTLLLIAECDYRSYLIPVWTLIMLFIVTVSSNLVTHIFDLTSLIIISIIYITLLILNTHYQWIGNGDIDLIFIILLKTNFHATVFIIMISSALAILKYGLNHNRKLIPYAPYLAIAYFIFLLIL